MTDITYRTDASEMVAHGTTVFTRIAAWCGQFADGAREGQQIAARYHQLSRFPARISPAVALPARPLGVRH